MKITFKQYVLIAAVGAALGTFIWLGFDFLVVDDCLDDGGRWLASEMRCEGRRQ